MKIAARVHAALTAWVLVLSAHPALGIMVKFGTNTGPIVPPTPAPVVVPVPPFRDPAPVWEDLRDDEPDPNATWRPRPLFTKIQVPFPLEKTSTHEVPTPAQTPVLFNGPDPSQVPTPTQDPTPPDSTTSEHYGHNLFSPETTNTPSPTQPIMQNNAQKFAASYIPIRKVESDRAESNPNGIEEVESKGPNPYLIRELTPMQALASNRITHLSSQFVPGLGIRYYIPLSASTHLKVLQKLKDDARRYEDSYQNHIDTNEVDSKRSDYYDALAEEKESRRRSKSTFLGSQNAFFYWPIYHHQRRQ